MVLVKLRMEVHDLSLVGVQHSLEGGQMRRDLGYCCALLVFYGFMLRLGKVVLDGLGLGGLVLFSFFLGQLVVFFAS